MANSIGPYNEQGTADIGAYDQTAAATGISGLEIILYYYKILLGSTPQDV